MMRTVEIAGGGVAGLAAGLALRRAGIPVRVHEAAVYPRHRLCGEFLSGAGEAEFAALGLSDLFNRTEKLEDMAWYAGDRLVLQDTLPEPARGLSRWHMEASMADTLRFCGGEVICQDRVAPEPDAEGWVWATGRPLSAEGKWYAEKEHYDDLETTSALEMHLCQDGYAGLSRVGNGRVNVCAMLPAAAGKKSGATLSERLRLCGLTGLADRLDRAQRVPGSRCGTSRFVTGWQTGAATGGVRIGDCAAVIPPFTGHGMSMAIQAALEAAPFIADWSAGRRRWDDAVQAADAALRHRFESRLRWAARVHPFLLRSAGRRLLTFILSCGINPTRWLYRRVR